MKKIFGALALCVALVFAFSGCASTSGANASALPWWCIDGKVYDTREADLHPGIKPAQPGMFGVGAGYDGDIRSRQISARLAARTALANYLKGEIAGAAVAKGVGDGVSIEKVDAILVGSRILDSVQAPDGTVYTVVFISNEDIKESAKEDPTLLSVVDEVIKKHVGE